MSLVVRLITPNKGWSQSGRGWGGEEGLFYSSSHFFCIYFLSFHGDVMVGDRGEAVDRGVTHFGNRVHSQSGNHPEF